jgi:hypothetical protein
MADEPAAKLTRKEREFAAAIAGGATLAAAYAKAYSDRAGRKPAEANARQVLRRERVAAEVERLRRYPPPDNFEAIREFAIEKLLKMAESDPNSVARHRAMRTLLEHSADGLRKSPALQQPTIAPVKKVDSAEIVAELRRLYQKSLGTVPPALIGGANVSSVNGIPRGDNVVARARTRSLRSQKSNPAQRLTAMGPGTRRNWKGAANPHCKRLSKKDRRLRSDMNGYACPGVLDGLRSCGCVCPS